MKKITTLTMFAFFCLTQFTFAQRTTDESFSAPAAPASSPPAAAPEQPQSQPEQHNPPAPTISTYEPEPTQYNPPPSPPSPAYIEPHHEPDSYNPPPTPKNPTYVAEETIQSGPPNPTSKPTHISTDEKPFSVGNSNPTPYHGWQQKPRHHEHHYDNYFSCYVDVSQYWYYSNFYFVNPAFYGNDAYIHFNPQISARFLLEKGDVFKYIYKNMRYSWRMKRNKLEGRVLVRFVVENDGTISRAEIIESPNRRLTKEAIRLVKSMNLAWSPAVHDGSLVRSYVSLPIVFSLDKNPMFEVK